MKRWNICAGGLAALIGLLIIIFPAFWVKTVVILLGLGAVSYGVYNLKYTKSLVDNTVYEKSVLIRSIVSIVVGVMAVLFPLAFHNAAWTVMTWVLIIYLILSAAVGFYTVTLMKDTNIERKRYVLENLVVLAIAVVLILISPKALGTAIVRIIGVIVMVAGIGFLAYGLLTKKDIIITEVEVKDDVTVDTEDTETSEE